MLGFSLPKLLVLILIIAVIWYGFKSFGSAGRRARRVEDDDREGGRAGGRNAGGGAVEMSRCGVCGDYVPEGAQDCGKTGCPYPL